MGRAQSEAINRQVRKIEDDFELESPADQLSTRTESKRDGEVIIVQVFGNIVNPDHGYESGEFWMDCFCVGPLGRIF